MNLGAVIIPARYQSTRFPGKPLVDINGMPMLQHVYNKCSDAVGEENVYVATDDKRIEDAVRFFDGQVIMTSSTCLTGTDRIAEANSILNLDFIVNVQGDEPMVNSSDIRLVFNKMIKNTNEVLNCYCDIEPEEAPMPTVPKVVISNSGRLMYMSRGACPFDKNGATNAKYKQVCIYGFGREHLEVFSQHPEKTLNEEIEDIEILRFLDLDIPVAMLKVSKGGIAVDTPTDLSRVKLLLSEYNKV
jgi:3-deoxy-manno-octulosonate cytidylyltransferase (CMP-KDO synthetase)